MKRKSVTYTKPSGLYQKVGSKKIDPDVLLTYWIFALVSGIPVINDVFEEAESSWIHITYKND
jgi:uncharacterized membrane protein YjjP (DUF1212 family)